MRWFPGLLLTLVAASAMLVLLSENTLSVQGRATSQIAGEGPPPSYGGTPMYDACSLITITDLAQLGVPLNDGWVVAHDYLDRDVPLEAAVSQRRSTPPAPAVTACRTGTRSRSKSIRRRTTSLDLRIDNANLQFIVNFERTNIPGWSNYPTTREPCYTNASWCRQTKSMPGW
ncbi:hypothetical protein SAMN04488074_111246 [Lentzea albidocapillata subsp. violacea]|uniref:Uncharacterized protein n=1 Tax=Lentzea albidocapillata subsp. violacea TaxID=128104 RepID=A0A1G9KV86_9PSEU|nr:hypothetical protein [Lentzea albidocapillata]SDL53397.1 hypothetical protein SAMN04488074_111246 [Lentzea albidocapillata subsp. violacea]